MPTLLPTPIRSYRASLLLLGLGLATACTGGTATDFGTETASLDASVRRGPLQRSIVADGSLYSPRSRPVSVQRIRWYWDYNISWTAEEGTLVKAGDVVVRLDPSAIQKDLNERENALKEAQLLFDEEKLRAADETADAVAAVASAEIELKRQKLLLVESDAVSEAEKQRQRLSIANAESALRRAREKVGEVKKRLVSRQEVQALKVQQAESEVSEMKAGLEKTELKAPQDGLLIFPLYSSNSGWQKARPGGSTQVNAALAEISDPKDLVARLYIPEVDADGITPDTPGTLTLSIDPARKLAGKVLSIASVPTTGADRDGSKSAKPADNIRQFEVLFQVANLPEQAMPGMSVRAELLPRVRDNALLVPIAALATEAPRGSQPPAPLAPAEGSDEARAAFVLAQQGPGKPWTWKAVTVGSETITEAEILSGLGEGEKVKVFAW